MTDQFPSLPLTGCHFCGAQLQPEDDHCSDCGRQCKLLAQCRILYHGDTTGVVTEGYDVGLGRRCLIRRIDARQAHNVRRMINIRTVLLHRNDLLTDIYALVEDETDMYLISEYVEGPTLAELLAESGPWSPIEVESLLKAMLHQLAQLHEAGIAGFGLHLDGIKKVPGRGYVLLGITDVAPIEEASPRSRDDLRDLGRLALSLLTGRAIEDGSAPGIPTGIPRRLGVLLNRLLAADPSDRPESARAALRALQGISREIYVALLLLAAIPPLLVVQDRWFDHAMTSETLQSLWCSNTFLCSLALPPYFLLSFVCVACMSGLFWLYWREMGETVTLTDTPSLVATGPSTSGQLHHSVGAGLSWLGGIGIVASLAYSVSVQRLPGWDLIVVLTIFAGGLALAEMDMDGFRRGVLERWSRLFDLLLAHIALLGFLASFYARGAYLPLFVLLLLVAGYRALAHRHAAPIYWIVSLAIVLFTIDINGWWFAVIGDEYSFYRLAFEIARQRSIGEIGQQIFDGTAVYETHPYFSSFLQAIPMWFFEAYNFGWRFSNLYFSAVTIALCFLAFRQFVGRRVALLAALLLASSHYLMSFGKIGYNNLQALLAMGLVLYTASLAIRTRRIAPFVLHGLSLAVCFYVFPAALYVVPLGMLFILMFVPPVTRKAATGWLAMAFAGGAAVFPLLLQPEYWATKIAGTAFYTPERIATPAAVITHVFTNLIYSLTSFLYVPDETHFVAVAYVDPLTAAFLMIGVVVMVVAARRQRFAQFALLGCAGLLILAGVTHDRETPSTTRMFLLLPFFALYAAYGLTWCVDEAQRIGLWPGGTRPLIAALIVTIVGLNLYLAYPLSRERMARYQMIQSLFLRTAEQTFSKEHDPLLRFVFLNDPKRLDVPSLKELLTVYQVPFREDQLIDINASELSPETIDMELLHRAESLVFVHPELDPQKRAYFEQALLDMGKQPCPILTDSGEERFRLWMDTGLLWICHA